MKFYIQFSYENKTPHLIIKNKGLDWNYKPINQDTKHDSNSRVIFFSLKRARYIIKNIEKLKVTSIWDATSIRKEFLIIKCFI